MPANLENSAVATVLGKVTFQSLKKDNTKECSNYCTIALISQASSKSLKLGLSSTWIENFQMYKLGLKMAEEPEIKLPTFEKAREF